GRPGCGGEPDAGRRQRRGNRHRPGRIRQDPPPPGRRRGTRRVTAKASASGLPAGMARLGFDVAALPFTLRTALAACAALLLGWLMGLDHAQWAAMTVWATSQPLRGQIFEKSLFRMAGT